MKGVENRVSQEKRAAMEANMETKNRRRFSRIHLQWAVRLDFGAVEYKRFVNNVSLGGLYVEGDFQQLAIGDICTVNLKQSGFFAEEAVQAVGSLSRISQKGIAVEFLSMKLDSFFFLQATLLYKAVNPALLGREFIVHNIFEIEGDLVFFEPAHVNTQLVKKVQKKVRNNLFRQQH